MRVVYLYGPPGVGKLSVATELVRLTGFKLLHNHLTVNVATALFERGTPPWCELIQHLRREVFIFAVRHRINLVITGVYAGQAESEQAWRDLLEPLFEGGANVQFVQLTCSRAQLLERVQSTSRLTYDKLVDADRLIGLLESQPIENPTVPFEPHFRLDTTALSAEQAASRIVAHYGLVR